MSYIKIWLPIVLAVLPSLIVGFSSRPKTRKISDILKYVLQFLSIVTPKDAAGTFKMPLTASAKLPPKTGDDPSKPIMGGMAMVFLILSCISFDAVSSTGCAGSGSFIKDSKDGVIHCGIDAIASDSVNLISTVYAIVTGGAVNWAQQLDALKSLGEDALSCALMVVGQRLQQESVPPTDTLSDSPVKMKARATAAAGKNKADDYLKAHNLHPQAGK